MEQATVPAWRSSWLWLCALLTGLKLWLILAQTVSAIAPALRDDELFLSHAETILKGEWLGRLTDLTLVKGPGYPLWLAANHLVGLPLLFSQAVLYALGCALLAIAVRPTLAAGWARALLYIVVLFNPSSWADGPATRVARDGFYSSLTLLLFAAAAGLALRLRDRAKIAVKWALGTGLAGAALAMTREEGLWVVPSLLFVVGFGILRARRRGWRSWAPPAAVAAAAYLIPLSTVAALNYRYYGLFTTCEMTTGYFEAAYGALTRVKTDTWNPYVPVPRDARRRIYAVSPAFREIAPYLEAYAPLWTENGCKNVGVCDDIAGGWFVWSFREAVNAAGKYSTGGEGARAWYRQLAREIDDACRARAIDCLPPRSTLQSPWRLDYSESLLSAYRRGLVFLVTFEGITPLPSAPQAGEFDLRRYELMIHERIPSGHVRLSGVLASREPVREAVVADSGERQAHATIHSEALPLQGAGTTDTALTRYSVDTPCTLGCSLMLLTLREGLVVPISGDPDERPHHLGSTPYHLESWRTEAFQRATVDEAAGTVPFRIAALRMLTRVYALGSPVLAIVALLALARRLRLAIRARVLDDASAVALALGGAVLVRLLLLALMDISAVRAIIVQYCAPGYALCVSAATLMVIAPPGLGRRSAVTSPSTGG